MTGRRSNQLNYVAKWVFAEDCRLNANNYITYNLRCKDFLWQGQKDSNSRHAVLETAALPTELYPCIAFGDPIRRYQKWWAFGDSNPGPTGYEPAALTN